MQYFDLAFGSLCSDPFDPDTRRRRLILSHKKVPVALVMGLYFEGLVWLDQISDVEAKQLTDLSPNQRKKKCGRARRELKWVLSYFKQCIRR